MMTVTVYKLPMNEFPEFPQLSSRVFTGQVTKSNSNHPTVKVLPLLLPGAFPCLLLVSYAVSQYSSMSAAPL